MRFKGITLSKDFTFTRPTRDLDLEITLDAFDFEPVDITPSFVTSGSNFASAGGSFSASGSGVSSISVSASSFVGDNGASSSLSVSATGDRVSGTGFAEARFGGSVDVDTIEFDTTTAFEIDLSAFGF
ncbi:MAG: hypothetical protein AAGI70_02760 [Pseudomonadota bacterium]